MVTCVMPKIGLMLRSKGKDYFAKPIVLFENNKRLNEIEWVCKKKK